MSNWLSNRLTPSKIKEARWVEFSTVLEHVWEEFFDPAISRLERLRSAYTADDADLIKKIREMGDYFSFDRPRYEDRPVSLAWRRLELEYKDMELILSSVFRRHYSNLPVTWFPIFAPVDQQTHPYGSLFEVAQGPWPEKKNTPPEDWFLTSRGCLGTDYGHLLTLGFTKSEFLESALPLLMRTKPLHIVYDGPLWYICYDFSFNANLSNELVWWEREAEGLELQFAVSGNRFDFTLADCKPLDMDAVKCAWQRDAYLFIKFYNCVNGLDSYLTSGLPESWTLPLDCYFPYVEENIDNPLSQIALIEDQFTLPFHVVTDFNSDSYSIDNLDHYQQFDLCPADSIPLDMAIGGKYA